jgi:hypothetical protein
MYVCSKVVPPQAAHSVAKLNHRLEQDSLARKHGTPKSSRSRGGPRDQLLHFRVATDDSVQRDDVRFRYLGRERHEIAQHKSHPSNETSPFGFLFRSIDIRRCRVDMDDGVRTGAEQLVMDDSDATADVQ